MKTQNSVDKVEAVIENRFILYMTEIIIPGHMFVLIYSMK